MNRRDHVTMGATAALLMLMHVLTVAPDPGLDTSGSRSLASSFAIRDPDPGFWRAQLGAISGSAQPLSVGMSALVAMTRIEGASGDDLELTNLGSSGFLMLESGALVLTDAEGLLALHRGGETAGLEPVPIGVGAMLMRGDRLAFHSSTTVALRNPEATAASLLLTTEIPELPSPAGGIVQ